jgi:nucleotide-binding universal stress UspA family protein
MQEGPIQRIVVGLDGSEHSAEALGWAVRMAHAVNAEVVAVHAVQPVMYWDDSYAPPPDYDLQRRAGIEDQFENEWCRPLRESGVPYRTVLEDGRAASVLADAADEVDADVIVVARRGRGGFTELLLGSVSHELTLHSHRPVLVLSPGGEGGHRKSGQTAHTTV